MPINPQKASYLHRGRRTPRRPASRLVDSWTSIDGVDVFYRVSPHAPEGAPVMTHLHGFGLSGRYLLPTADIIRRFMADQPIGQDPASPGHATLYEVHRGTHHPPVKN